MHRSLKTKNKIAFLDGTISKPDISDATYQEWDQCNTTIFSWITDSLEDDIASSVMWMDSAKDVWDELRKRYFQGDAFPISHIQEEIYALK